MGHTIPQATLMVAFGIFIWTLIEGNTVHYLLYGCHHKHPMDGLRLVFPPAATAILLFWNSVKLIAAPSATPAFFGGGLLGYVIYDCTHYYLHLGHPSKDRVLSSESSLHNSKQGFWNNFFILGYGLWHTESWKTTDSHLNRGKQNVQGQIPSFVAGLCILLDIFMLMVLFSASPNALMIGAPDPWAVMSIPIEKFVISFVRIARKR